MNPFKAINFKVRRKVLIFLAFFVFCCLGSNATLHAYLHAQSTHFSWESADHESDSQEHGSDHHHYDEEKLYLLSRPASSIQNDQVLPQLLSIPWDSENSKISLPAFVPGSARWDQSLLLLPSGFFSSHGNKAPPAL